MGRRGGRHKGGEADKQEPLGISTGSAGGAAASDAPPVAAAVAPPARTRPVPSGLVLLPDVPQRSAAEAPVPGAPSSEGSHLFPITPLGLPRTPPPLPPFPGADGGLLQLPEADVFTGSQGAAAGATTGAAAATGGPAIAAEEAGGSTGSATQGRIDRRTYFHTIGKPLSFQAYSSGASRTNPEEECAVGEHVELKVEEIHFGNPRVKLTGAPAPMMEMLKWQPEKFGDFVMECAQISFGKDYRVWCAVGIPANRLLYALKRCQVETVLAVVVAPPPLPADEDVDPTYGVSIQGIQLIP